MIIAQERVNVCCERCSMQLLRELPGRVSVQVFAGGDALPNSVREMLTDDQQRADFDAGRWVDVKVGERHDR